MRNKDNFYHDKKRQIYLGHGVNEDAFRLKKKIMAPATR